MYRHHSVQPAPKGQAERDFNDTAMPHVTAQLKGMVPVEDSPKLA